ncbi:MAG TPA: MerR family transcriptional regulator [Acidimicrobiales bacterium]|jgi:DNA-binding transcriptional MerR regulator|nr:MerR family transcriptional regulator [Acidimicrobiales bacterium]
MRVEDLSARAGVSVDTIRYYQSKGLLPAPRRQGRVAWYDDDHVDRIARVRSLQSRGFTLATIVRLVNGELDAADEALLGELAGSGLAETGTSNVTATTTSGDSAASGSPGTASTTPGDPSRAGGLPPQPIEPELFTIEALALRTGVPLPLLRAVESEGLLVPRRVGSEERYTSEDVDAAQAGLALLEWGVPLSALLELGRRHHAATVSVAREAVDLFSVHIRGSLREQDPGEQGPVEPGPGNQDPGHQHSAEEHPAQDDAAGTQRLVEAYAQLLPAVTTLVGHHFTRTLLKAALDHIEQVGTPVELQAVRDQGDDEAAAR